MRPTVQTVDSEDLNQFKLKLYRQLIVGLDVKSVQSTVELIQLIVQYYSTLISSSSATLFFIVIIITYRSFFIKIFNQNYNFKHFNSSIISLLKLSLKFKIVRLVSKNTRFASKDIANIK